MNAARTPPAPAASPPAQAPVKGRLEWPLLLQWLREDGFIGPADAERVTARFRAGASSLHPLVRLGGAGLLRRGSGAALDTEAL
ncbi:MAG: type II/IV secretion system protein, partial [Betaproteobacteria bacterium]